ncbi:MAG TPA: LCP family protein [Actinomycetota bacterium]|nr:LCP family protein [Actinomycetota bacterium]
MWPFKRESDPFSSARYSGMFKSVRTRQRAHLRHWWQWALLGLFGLIIVLGGFGIWRYFDLKCKISCGADPTAGAPEGEPFNVLLIGSDSRAGLTEQEQFDFGAEEVGGERADTLILAHIDPANNHVTMVQFPRDLYVPIAGGGSNKINTALTGGVRGLVRTVEQLTHLRIHDFAKVNIAGFRDLVDAIGGVELCMTEPLAFDPQTGIEITEEEVPGLVHFDGERALRFVRSRNFPTGDFERIQNQQRFVSAAINKVTSSETLFHPTRILKLVDAAGKHLRASLDPFQLKDLADRLKNFDPEHYEAYTAPNLGTAANEAGSVVLPDEPTMDLLFKAISRNESPAEADGVPNVEPSTIRVGVYNGSFIDGAATTVADELQAATDIGDGPVNVVEVANAGRLNHKGTTIVYAPEALQMAELLGAALPQAELLEGRTKRGIDVAVIVGQRGFETRQIVQINPIPIPKPGDVPAACRK